MKLFGSTKNLKTKQKTKKMFQVLKFQSPNKCYTYLLNIKPSKVSVLENFDKFDEIIIKFTDQDGRPLEIDDKVNLTLLTNKQKLHAHRDLQCDDIS